jgi:hypothetical protein
MAHPLCASSGLFYSLPWSGASVLESVLGLPDYNEARQPTPPPIPSAAEIDALLKRAGGAVPPSPPSPLVSARVPKMPRNRPKNEDSRLESGAPARRPVITPAAGAAAAASGAAAAPSNALLKELKRECERMLAEGVVYEDEYWTEPVLDDFDYEHKKLYLINAGDPMDPNRVQTKSKNVTAYVGASRNAIAECVYDKNNPQVVHKDPETRHAITRWMLFCVVFFPREWDARPIDAAMQYLRCGHGVVGKLKRCFELADLFNLRTHVPQEREAFVVAQCPRRASSNKSVKFRGGQEGPPLQ